MSITGGVLNLSSAAVEGIDIQVEEFKSKMCSMIEWRKKFKSYDGRDFGRYFLVPRSMIDYSSNSIAFIYGFAAIIFSRKLKDFTKEMRYNVDQDFIDEFLFIFSLLSSAISNKRIIFKRLQENNTIKTQQDLNMLVFASLVDTYASLKAGEESTKQMFNEFKSTLSKQLRMWKLEIKKAQSISKGTIKIILKGVVKNDGKSKSELQEQKGVICRPV